MQSASGAEMEEEKACKGSPSLLAADTNYEYEEEEIRRVPLFASQAQ